MSNLEHLQAMQSTKAIEDASQRRKVQNRLNQRARRQRIKEQDSSENTNIPQRYKVDRWRYAYQSDANSHLSTAKFVPSGKEYVSQHVTERDEMAASDMDQVRRFQPCPTQDHLLHLIHLNVLRGMFDNKLLFLASVSYLAKSQDADMLQVLPPEQVFPGRAAVILTETTLPESLHPTPLQNTLTHATCIDLIPFPRIRDNLIEHEGQFSWQELIEDLVGHLVDPFCFVMPLRQQASNIAETIPPFYGEEDDYTANRNGLIVWGDAHLPRNWELTLGFLRKWGWVIKGCPGIIKSTNMWRKTRGEQPLMPSIQGL